MGPYLEHKRIIHTFKTVGETPIDLCVYYAEKPAVEPAPVLLYWHGGYLVTGDREDAPIWFINSCLRRGWPFVSANYRLIPESTALDTLEDLRDAYSFVRKELGSMLPYKIDPSRIVFGGSSAGGYCALLAAVELRPPPRAAFLCYPVANPSSDRYVHRGNLLVNAPQGTKVDAVISEIEDRIKNNVICVGQSLNARPDRRTSQYMRYIIQEGVYADYLSGVKGLSRRIVEVGEQKAVPEHARKVFPTAFGIRKDLPPMIIVHGRADRSIYISESQRLVERLSAIGAEFEFHPIELLDHAFDFVYLNVEDGTNCEPGAQILKKSLHTLDKWVDSPSSYKM